MKKISPEIVRELQIVRAVVDIAAAPHGEKNSRRDAWAARIGISKSLFDRARQKYELAPRKRSDKGRRQIPEIESWVKIVHDTKRLEFARSGQWLSTRSAITQAETAGLIPVGKFVVYTCNQIAREIGLDLVRPPRI